MSNERALTIRQPWADLIMAGVKGVENRTWPAPSTLPRHSQCDTCPERFYTHGAGSHRHCPGLPERPGAWSLSTDLGPFPFRLWVHAASSRTLTATSRRGRRSAGHGTSGRQARSTTSTFVPACCLGSVMVTGCHHWTQCIGNVHYPQARRSQLCSDWAEREAYHWSLAAPQPLPEPIPMRGAQGLWTFNLALAEPA